MIKVNFPCTEFFCKLSQLFMLLFINIARRNLILVTLGIKRVKTRAVNKILVLTELPSAKRLDLDKNPFFSELSLTVV